MMPFDYTFSLAADETMRRYDQDGRLHVRVSHVTKATVNGYLGREIPGYEQLGLNPDQEYRLLRDPKELEKATQTWNNIPLLDRHVPVTAADAKRERVVGSTGTDAHWNPPYIDVSLVFWDDKAIALIESGQQRELSSAYRYVPVMQPGEYEDMRYDGVMTNIRANHVALVEDGRAGSDVVVMDSIKGAAMEKLSPCAAWMAAHLAAYVKPMMAQDQKMPDMKEIMRGTTAKNWKSRLPVLEAKITRALRGKLAQDAEIHIHEHLAGSGESAPDAEMEEPMPTPLTPASGAAPGAPQEAEAKDDDLGQKIREFLQSLGGRPLDPEDIESIVRMCQPEAANPTAPEDNGEDQAPPPEGGKPPFQSDRKAKDENPDIDAGKQPVPAMDGAKIAKAIKLAKDEAVAATIKRMNSIAEAREAVAPYVGKIKVAMDSAEDIYAFALETLGVDTKNVPPAAFPVLLAMKGEALNAAKTARGASSVAMAKDSKAAKSFLERYPEAARVRVIG